MLLVALGLPCPSVDAILKATGGTRSRAYDISSELIARLPSLVSPRGRPPKAPSAPPVEAVALTAAVLAYVLAHPGCAHREDERQHYSDGFRHFVLGLRAQHAGVDAEAFAAAVHVPLGTLKDWLRAPLAEPNPPGEPNSEPSVESLHFQTVIDAWGRWHGTFVGFCTYLREDLHVPLGRSLVRSILAAHGLRQSARRSGRSPDESALRGAFKTYFPGAQWVGDGMQVPVIVNGTCFTYNLELNVDAYSGAFVGVSVRDQEDGAAVVEAFNAGIETTGASPLALLLDNRPSNYTPEVQVALDGTLSIRATPQRPQNKAHVEGAFGLFSQVLPSLVLDTSLEPREIGKRFLSIVASLWTRTTNHRPRPERAGRSRVELYSDTPSDEQLAAARRELKELAARQERARRTLEARRRPEVLALLDEHFARLSLLDPDRHFRVAIAGYPLNAILAGIAIFEGKQSAKTLPEGADARYLLGIIRNVAAETECEHVARRLLELRLAVRDSMLATLIGERDSLIAIQDIPSACNDCVDEALATSSPLERAFWLDSLAELIRDRGGDNQHELFLSAARRVQTTFAVPIRDRESAIRLVAERLVALE